MAIGLIQEGGEGCCWHDSEKERTTAYVHRTDGSWFYDTKYLRHKFNLLPLEDATYLIPMELGAGKGGLSWV